MEDLKQLLANSGHRLTTARKLVFKAMLVADQPLSMAQIHSLCPKINRTSVYRVLGTFLSLGIATEVPRGWKLRYELAEPFNAHHHHLQCQKCGEVVTLNQPELESAVHSLASKYKYTLTSHHIELHGICSKCL